MDSGESVLMLTLFSQDNLFFIVLCKNPLILKCNWPVSLSTARLYVGTVGSVTVSQHIFTGLTTYLRAFAGNYLFFFLFLSYILLNS